MTAKKEERFRVVKEKGFPIMPKAETATTATVTDMGWVDPLDIYYWVVVNELHKLRAGHSSVGNYADSRCKFHKKHVGDSRMAEELLRLEEHAFYLLIYKLAAHAVTTSESLSTELRMFLGEALEFSTPMLKRLTTNVLKPRLHTSLSSEACYKDIFHDIYQVCVAGAGDSQDCT